MHFLQKIKIQREKCRREYYSKQPILYDKITSIEDMNYLNLIDRTFYLIRLREKFYNKHKDVLGIEDDPDDDILCFTTDPEIFLKQEYEYTLDEFIKEMDRNIVREIVQNITTIKVFYKLDDLEHALKSPKPLLLENPNLFFISFFLFSLSEWFQILHNDISKIYGNPKRKIGIKFSDTETYIYLKIKLRIIPGEVEKRINTSKIKNYRNHPRTTIIIDTEELNTLLSFYKFNDKIGAKNSDLKIKNVIAESEKRELKSLLKFNYDKNKLYTIFSLWLQLKINEDKDKRQIIINFIEFFHAETEDISMLKIPNLSLLRDSLYEMMSIIKYLRKWSKDQGAINKNVNPIVSFKKVENLFYLFKRLDLAPDIKDPATFRDYYYRKTEFPDRALVKIKHHLH